MQRIGLLSDSHGEAERTARAVQLLVDRGAELLIHLGDVSDERVLESLIAAVDGEGRPVPPVRVVFGNVDDERGLARHAERLGLTVDHPVGRLEVAGKVLVFQHGHHDRTMREATAAGVDYLCHGHTHAATDARVGGTRVINPGALRRAARHTVALLDAAEDQVTFLEVPDGVPKR